jgi:hypothetical protein
MQFFATKPARLDGFGPRQASVRSEIFLATGLFFVKKQHRSLDYAYAAPNL